MSQDPVSNRPAASKWRTGRVPASVSGLVLGLAALLVMVVLLLPFQGMRPRRVILGSETVTPTLSGFSFPEIAADGTSYRWSEAAGAVRFADVANRPLLVRVYLHALRPSTPATVTLTLNDQRLAEFVAGGAFSEVTALADRSAVGWQGEVTVGIEAEPFTVPPDTRLLGAAVAWVEIAPAGTPGGPGLPPRAIWRGVILPLVLAALALLLLGQHGRIPLALSVALVSLVTASGAFALWRAPALALAVAPWLAGLVGLSAATLAWGPSTVAWARPRLSTWQKRHPVGFWVVIMAVGALFIYLPLAATEGYWGDIEIYMAWTHQITHHGIHTAYNPEAVARPNTTPGLLYPFRLIGEVFQRVWAPTFPPTWLDRTDQGYLRYMLRLPGMLATLAIALVVFRVVKWDWGQRLALIASAAYLFNPAVIFETAYMGQTGAVHGLFILLGLVGLARGRPALGWLALGVGMLTKPQADIFLPLFAIFTLVHYGWRATARSAFALICAALVLLAPFLVHGTLGYMWERISRPVDYHPFLSATAHNIWWLFSLGQGKTSDLLMPPFLAGLGWPIFTYRAIGMGLFGLAYLAVLARIWRERTPRSIYLSAAYLFTAFFMLATQIHENHLTPMFAILLLACGSDRRYWRIYWLFAFCAALNMGLHYPQILRWLVPHNPDVWGGVEMAPWRWLSSLLQVGVFVYWTALFLRETAAGLRAGPARLSTPSTPAR